jgi:arylsulfatase A-like enzyme
MRRTALPLVACVLCVAALLQGQQVGQGLGVKKPWNFLLIVVDTLRYDATSMGGTDDTPFLKSVARRSVAYSRAYSPHDSTPSAHFSLFTGFRDGWQTKLDRPDLGLPFQLAQLGYSTFGISANGTITPTTMAAVRGFRQYHSLLDEWHDTPPVEKERIRKEIDARLAIYGARLNDFNRDNGYCTGDRVVTHLSGVLGAVTEPFFGFINIIEPHDPYLPSAGALAEFQFDKATDPDIRWRTLGFPLAHPEQVMPPARRESILARLRLAENRAWSLSDDLTKEQLRTYRGRYLGEVRDADRVVRQIMLVLEKQKLLENTWVIITSDHGEAFGEGGFVTHWLSNGGDREATRHVPLVWSGPVRIERSLSVSEDVSLMDVAPTIYDMVGIDWHPIAAVAPDVPFGRSLVHQLAAVVMPGKSVPKFKGELPSSVQEGLRKDAIERLRSLGYIR